MKNHSTALASCFKSLILTSAFALVALTAPIGATGSTAWARTFLPPIGSIELAQSVPIETTLMVPGIRMTQQVWLDMINEAQNTIDLEEFYIYSQTGQSLVPILTALQAAAARGVKIRVLVDHGFFATYPTVPTALNQIAGFQVKTVDFSSLGGIQHSKYFVVDQTDAFVGSANFDWLALTHIHEVGLHVTDPAISAQLETIFNKDWMAGATLPNIAHSFTHFTPFAEISNSLSQEAPFEGSNEPRGVPAPSRTVWVLASPPADLPAGINPTLPAVLQLIGSAKRSLLIQVYEYDTEIYPGNQHWQVLDTAIRAAAARGVQIQLLVDAVSLKSGKADLEGLASVKGIQVRVVTIPQWSGGPIPYARLVHSKYMVVDGVTGWVGSENWSDSYFTTTRNVGLVVTAPLIVHQLMQIHQQVWTSSYLSAP